MWPVYNEWADFVSSSACTDVNGEVRLPDGDSSFTLDNVEFADASDKEDSLPDAMTSYEADRLLSSRCVLSNDPFFVAVSMCISDYVDRNVF